MVESVAAQVYLLIPKKTEPVYTMLATILRAEDCSGLYCPPSNGGRGTTMRIPYSRHELVDGNG